MPYVNWNWLRCVLSLYKFDFAWYDSEYSNINMWNKIVFAWVMYVTQRPVASLVVVTSYIFGSLIIYSANIHKLTSRGWVKELDTRGLFDSSHHSPSLCCMRMNEGYL